MGFWLFLSFAVAGHLLLKAYKLRMFSYKHHDHDGRVARLEEELSLLKKHSQDNHQKRLEQLEETVYFGDFELKRQFHKLENEAKR